MLIQISKLRPLITDQCLVSQVGSRESRAELLYLISHQDHETVSCPPRTWLVMLPHQIVLNLQGTEEKYGGCFAQALPGLRPRTTETTCCMRLSQALTSRFLHPSGASEKHFPSSH